MISRTGLCGQVRLVQIPGQYIEGATPLPPWETARLCKEGCASSRVTDNIVTDQGIAAMAGMIGHGLGGPLGAGSVVDISDLRITSMRLGAAAAPPIPLATDTDISVVPPLYTVTFVSAFYPTPGTVTLAGVVPQTASALDGVGITEEGLFTEGGAMFSKVTFSSEVKVPTNALQIEHSIVVSRA